MNFHPLSIKLLKKGEEKPVYVTTRDDMDIYEFHPLISLELENVTFHVGDIVYIKDTFYIFSMIPSLRLNQYGLEGFGFIALRENTEFFYNLKDNDYSSSKKQINVLTHSDDFYNFVNQNLENAVIMSKENYQFIGNPFYMDMYGLNSIMSDILIEKYPEKTVNIQLEELFRTITVFYTVNFRLPILSNNFEDTLDSLMKKSNYDSLFYISLTNDWSFRLITTDYTHFYKELKSVGSNSYLAGTVFELKENETTEFLTKRVSNIENNYKKEFQIQLENQKQILIYLTKEGTIRYADKSMEFVENYKPLMPLREQFFKTCHRYDDIQYKEKLLNIIR